MLTDKQQAFVEAYLREPNGKAAAIEAGYSPRRAVVAASEMLKNPKIRQVLDKRRSVVVRKGGSKHTVTAETIEQELANLAFASAQELEAWGQWAKLSDKVKALELLGKRRGMWVNVTAKLDADELSKLSDSELVAEAEKLAAELKQAAGGLH